MIIMIILDLVPIAFKVRCILFRTSNVTRSRYSNCKATIKRPRRYVKIRAPIAELVTLHTMRITGIWIVTTKKIQQYSKHLHLKNNSIPIMHASRVIPMEGMSTRIA